MNPNVKKRLIFAAKILIILAVAVWIVWELYKAWGKIYLLDWQPDFFWLALSGVLYVVAYLPAAFFWRLTMQSLGQQPGLYESLRAYYIGHLGKYVPGKAMVVVLRSGLLRHDRTRMSIAAAAVFLETLTMMASGAFLSALIVVLWFRDLPGGSKLVLIAVGMMFLAGLPILPPIFRAITKKIGVGRNDPEIDRKLQGLRFQTLGIGWVLTLISWVVLGLSLWATIKGIGIDIGSWNQLFLNWPRFILAASLPVVLGFAMMIPAGIGVREFAMVQVLSPYFAGMLIAAGMPVEDAAKLAAIQGIAVAAVQRGISILGELVISALFFKGQKIETETPPSEEEG